MTTDAATLCDLQPINNNVNVDSFFITIARGVIMYSVYFVAVVGALAVDARFTSRKISANETSSTRVDG